jgi:DNA-binding transcriptional LysR family regulator
MDWDDFRYLRAVAQTGSVRSAGQLLCVHGSTVARRLAQLEQRLGAKLFARTAQGMELTPVAAGVLDKLQQVAAELEQVERSLQRDSAAPEPVRLALPRDLALRLVIPNLPDLYGHHPDLEVALQMGSAIQQLQEASADVAVCLTDDPPQDLVGRRLGSVMACPYAVPACLSRLDAPASGPCWVGPDHPGSLSATVRARYFPRLRQGLRLEDADLSAAALLAGLGVGLLPCHIGDSLDGLVRAGEPVRAGEVWLLTRPESRGDSRIHSLSAFLQEVFVRARRALEGDLVPGRTR